MKSQRSISTAVITLLSLVAMPAKGQDSPQRHHHYKLIDTGTFGGPSGGIVNPSSLVLNNRGMLIGASDTATPDPFAPDCFLDCSVVHGWIWQEGALTDLGTLPGGVSSIASSINARGAISGQAQNGSVDPLTGWPEADAVLWEHGQISNLGTLGGSQANANAINNRGEIVGAALTSTADPFGNSPLSSCFYLATTGFGCPGGTFATDSVFAPGTTQTHAFLWNKGVMRDLGTLGGPDSAAWIINDHGAVAGWSFTSFVPNPSTGVPTVDPFVWSPKTGNKNGKMIDLGGFGGTFGSPQWMNKRGQVVGSSNLPGDAGSHPFLWSKGVLTDLKTFSDLFPFGVAFSINDAGEVVGTASNSQNGVDAFFWKDGVLKNLGTVDGDQCSQAFSINEKSQVVGVSDSCATGADLHGFLWENGGPIIDLNKLVVPSAGLTVVSAVFITERGEIGCLGTLANGDAHGCLLIPCDESHADVEGCDYAMAETSSAAQISAPSALSGRSPEVRGEYGRRISAPERHRGRR
jgi:probable HAF family extracellular repeat protein